MTFMGSSNPSYSTILTKKAIMLKCVVVNPISVQTFHCFNFNSNQSKKNQKTTKHLTKILLPQGMISSQVVAHSIC